MEQHTIRMNTQTPQPPNSSMWMGDLLWKPQQHAIRMETRWPQLLKQNKLSSDSTATRNRGEDTNATAALKLDESGSTTAAQNLGKDTHASVTCNPSENTNAAAAKEKQKEKRSYVEVARKNEKTKKRDGEIRRLVERKRNTAKGDKHQLKELNKRIKKCIREGQRTKRQEKIQRILEEFRGIKSISCVKSGKEENAHPECEKRQKRDKHIKKKNYKCIRRTLQQA